MIEKNKSQNVFFSSKKSKDKSRQQTDIFRRIKTKVVNAFNSQHPTESKNVQNKELNLSTKKITAVKQKIIATNFFKIKIIDFNMNYNQVYLCDYINFKNMTNFKTFYNSMFNVFKIIFNSWYVFNNIGFSIFYKIKNSQWFVKIIFKFLTEFMQKLFEIDWKTLSLFLSNWNPYWKKFWAYMNYIIIIYKILQYHSAICEKWKDLNEHFYHDYFAKNWFHAYFFFRVFKHHHCDHVKTLIKINKNSKLFKSQTRLAISVQFFISENLNFNQQIKSATANLTVNKSLLCLKKNDYASTDEKLEKTSVTNKHQMIVEIKFQIYDEVLSIKIIKSEKNLFSIMDHQNFQFLIISND